ncbi:NAD(P)/FAD-dependent oxidoreductase [Lignipirellula cremea]|uniref:FAD-dependent oxidoreductase LodB n=1 Tax=Lignipirellula cremea TaxID=2528010 RepID=A0A518DR37_9BACT|nr:NAD(P)/FAD-dependent oxidoreductase [Lignipirellula cremea]QDU94301.1 Putative FAD-dependent oxidoreductase LodB [Lignipirellula cremea]
MKSEYDCIVLGGGPAGSSAAALTAEAGLSTLLLEREKLPRFHVGESLMPEAYWVFERLGVLDKMKQSDFVKKVSVQFVTSTGKESQPFFFKQHDPRECVETWQVERARFDQMLFENAAEKGAEALDQTRVRDVLFDGDKAVGVRLETADQQIHEVGAKVVVDGTGQQSLIANKLGLKVEDPSLKKIAIWTYYENAIRDPGENGGATIIMHTRDKDSWFWFIPLSNNITSIGVVADRDYLLNGRGSPEEIYAEELAICPGLQERLKDAVQCDKHRVAKEFSYTTRQRSGDGWVLIGDAYGFIDPIYSSGVYFALKSGELAADAIVEGFARQDLSGAQLGKWTEGFDGGTIWIRKLVEAYYANEFSFGGFLKTNMQHVGNLTDLLIGRIFYDGAGRIFDDMTPAIEQARQDASRMA